ncbi:MAG: hypothetical protein ACRYF1_26435 [Janthinobacterium lividum]
MRKGEVVGFWYTDFTRPGKASRDDAPGSRLRTNYRGLLKTADNRVVGLNGNIVLTPDIADTMHRMLAEAAVETLAYAADRATADFVDGLQEALWSFRGDWTQEHEKTSFEASAWLDGVRSWRHDDNRDETMAALKALHFARGRLVDRFVATLDPLVVDTLSRIPLSQDDYEHKRRLGEAWPLLDDTFGKGAPLRDSILPVIDEPRRVTAILRRHLAARPSPGKQSADLEIQYQRERMRQFLPEVEPDLVGIGAPGFQ